MALDVQMPNGKDLSSSVRVFCKALVFSLVMTAVFLLLSISTSNSEFLKYGYTGGSDDLTYLMNVRDALLLNGPSMLDLREMLTRQTEHAPAYPFILYFFSKIIPLDIFLAVFLNFFALYFVALIVASTQNLAKTNFCLWGFILLSPGIVFVAFHAYKDIFLLLMVLIAIKALNEKRFLLALIFSFFSGYFRPFNWALILLAYMLSRRFWLTIFLLITSSTIVYFIDPNFVYEVVAPFIETAHNIAYRDISDAGSSYQPYDNFLIDYFLGLIRFIFLPVPWAIAWDARPLFLSFLEFFQSIIVWTVSLFALIKPKKFWNFLRDQGILFWYCILHASAYSLLFFGNAQPRYRVYVYLISFYALSAAINSVRRPILKDGDMA